MKDEIESIYKIINASIMLYSYKGFSSVLVNIYDLKQLEEVNIEEILNNYRNCGYGVEKKTINDRDFIEISWEPTKEEIANFVDKGTIG